MPGSPCAIHRGRSRMWIPTGDEPLPVEIAVFGDGADGGPAEEFVEGADPVLARRPLVRRERLLLGLRRGANELDDFLGHAKFHVDALHSREPWHRRLVASVSIAPRESSSAITICM